MPRPILRRPSGAVGRTLWVAGLVLLLAALAASRLAPTPGSDLLVSDGSEIGEATAVLEDRFGSEPIVVSLEGDLAFTLAPENLVRLLRLEGGIAELDGVGSVYGPGTFINQTIIQTEEVVKAELGAVGERATEAAQEARDAAVERGASAGEADAAAERAREEALGAEADAYRDLLVRVGSIGLPALSNTAFVRTLVFGAGVEPKQRFQWLFPDASHAVILIRPAEDVEADEVLALGDEIEALAGKAGLRDVEAKVAGFPLLAAELERETRSEILRLAPVAIIAMLVLLLVVLRRRRGRFAALGLALGGTLLAAGVSWPLGLGLSVSTVAALPVVLGLGLDFAVQLQARYWHERDRGRPPTEAARAARSAIGPTLGLAAGAMTVAFLVLLLSSVPLLDRLGAFLALGTLSSLAMALLVGPALLVALDRGPVAPIALPRKLPVSRWRLRPAVLAIVAGVAIGGLAVSGQTDLETDLAALAPSGMDELEATERLQEALGTSGQVRVAVQAPDVTDPDVVKWMGQAGERILEAQPELRPGPSLPELVTGGGTSPVITREAIDGILDLLPDYFVDAVITEDRRVAELSYGIPLVPVAEQAEIVGDIRAALRGAPPDVEVTVAGLVAAATSSTEDLEGARPDLLLLATLLVALILLAAWRDVRRVAIVLAPALLAAGLAALVLVLVGLDLSPLGAALEPLVLAVGLEFGMLLDMRYREARAAGRSPARAREESTREIGGAVALSAGTVAAGFAVLVASRLPLLAQLGWLVALELALCLVAALVVVPALNERRDRGSGRAGPTGPGTSADDPADARLRKVMA